MLTLLLTLYALDGSAIHVNTRHIVSLNEYHSADDVHKLLSNRVQCIISLSNNKRITVAESCKMIKEEIEQLQTRGKAAR